MNHPQWWLFGVAFLLGLVLTFALMIRRVTREVPVSALTDAASVGKPGTDAESQVSTTTIPVADEAATTRIPVAGEKAPTTKTTAPGAAAPPATDPASESETRIPAVQETSTTEIPAAEVDSTTVHGKRRRWWIISAVVVAAVGAGGVVLAESQHPPTPAAPASTSSTDTTPGLVTNSSLAGLLLPAQQVADIIGARRIGKDTTVAALLSNSSRLIAEEECIGAWTPAQQGVYNSTGPVGAQVDVLTADEVPLRHIAYQSVIEYPFPR